MKRIVDITTLLQDGHSAIELVSLTHELVAITLREGNMISIRAANMGDADLLANLGRQTFQETFAADNTPDDMDAYMSEAFKVETIATSLQQPGNVWLLAETPSKVIGYAMLGPEPISTCITTPAPVRLCKLYVCADAIGMGAGATLMQACMKWARAAGYKSLWLGVWEHNHRARAFYERLGFVTVGEELFQLGSDNQTDLLMQLAFTETYK